MTAKYHNDFKTQNVAQTEPTPGRNEVKNSAGAYVYPVTDMVRLDRFLILGNEGGTYYATEAALTKESGQCVLRLIAAGKGIEVVDRIVEVSATGRAAKNDSALFALAICAGCDQKDVRKYALSKLNAVARIGTHLFTFAAYIGAFRGWGRLLKQAINRWYLTKNNHDLAYDVMKYRSRMGWSHRDLLRKARPKTNDPVKKEIFNWVCKGKFETNEIYSGEMLDKLPSDAKALVRLRCAHDLMHCAIDNTTSVSHCITTYNLPREVLHTSYLQSQAVWQALFTEMPMTALIRNLNKLTGVGVLAPLSTNTSNAVAKITDEERIKKARLHPYALYLANAVYSRGFGDKGSLTWTPNSQICAALEDAFYKSFVNAPPTNKRIVLAIDVSPSMNCTINGGVLTARDVAAAQALVTVKTEDCVQVLAFAGSMVPIALNRTSTLIEARRLLQHGNWRATDCAAPILHALNHQWPVDAFVIYTDNETWSGKIKPVDALKKYRDKMGIPAKLIVVGITATQFSIADPNDAGMLDCVGFDTNTPKIISDFIRG